MFALICYMLYFPLQNPKTNSICGLLSYRDTEIGILSTSPVTSHPDNLDPDMPGRRQLANPKANIFEQFTSLMVKSSYSSTSNR